MRWISLLAGENVEELFSRIAVVAFEKTLMKEIEDSSLLPTNGQLSSTSNIICKSMMYTYKRCSVNAARSTVTYIHEIPGQCGAVFLYNDDAL